MKIGTLLTSAIVSLAAVGGGLAVYVAATKYQTMGKVDVAQRRLQIVRAVGDLPRYLSPERGFATNILFGPPAVDPKMRAELNDKYRKQTDGARDKMNEVRATLPGALDDGAAVAGGIDGLNAKFAALRESIDKALDGPAEARRDAAKKMVADNAAINSAATALLDEQVRKIALLDGDAYRQANYANIAWTLRDAGGISGSLHKGIVGARRAATEAEKMDLSRAQGRTDQIVLSLQELRGNPATPANVAAALNRMNDAYVERFGQELKMVREGAVTGKFEHDVDAFFAESQRGLASVVEVRDAFYDNAEHILGSAYAAARFSFLIALGGLAAVVIASFGLVTMVRRRVCKPIVELTATMSRLASGNVAGAISGSERDDEIGAMAAAVQVFKDNMIKADQLSAEKEAESEIKMRRASALDELTRAFEAKVGELVGGLSSASAVMEDTAQSMSSTALATNRQAGVVAAASQQTSANVQTVASATEELTSSIAEIGRPRRRERPPQRRYRALAGRGRAEDRRRRHPDPEHRRADQPARAQRHHRGGARRRRRTRFCRGGLRSQIAGRPDRKSHHRNIRADRRHPGGERRDGDGDPQRGRRDRRDRSDRRGDRRRDRATGVCHQGDLPECPGSRARHPGGHLEHFRRPESGR
jgi:HAMP domain-containing protein